MSGLRPPGPGERRDRAPPVPGAAAAGGVGGAAWAGSGPAAGGASRAAAAERGGGPAPSLRYRGYGGFRPRTGPRTPRAGLV